jgi:hypothetical protein
MKKHFLLLLLVLVFFKSEADTDLVIKDPHDYLHYRINLNSKELLSEQKNGLLVNQGKLTFSNIDLRDFKELTNQTFDVHGKILITIYGTGQLYEIDIKNKIFSRLDSTYFRGYNFSSIRFFRKDTLYSLGGRGFWHINNIETFFSNKLHEWEILNPPLEESPQRILKQFGGYDKKRDIVSVIESSPLYYQKAVKDYHYKYFEKNLKSNEWKLLGDVNSELLFKLGVKSLNSIFIKGIYLFLDNDIVVLGDPIKNKIYVLEKSLPGYNSAFELSENRGYLFSYFIDNDFNNTRFKVDSISIEKLKSLGVPKGDFYVNENNEQLLFAILGLFIGGILLIYFFNSKKRKQIKLKLSELPKSDLLDALPEGSYEFLKNVLTHPKGHELSSQKITELMGFSNFAYDTQRQARPKLINSINSYFKVYHKIDSIMLQKKSNDDKRFYVYWISEEHYDTLKIILNGYSDHKN